MDQSMVVGGVDTHAATHCAAVIDANGAQLATAEFPATPAGYRQLLAWMRSHGELVKVGVEGTGSYGAGLARVLTADGVVVVEVCPPVHRNIIHRRRRAAVVLEKQILGHGVLLV